MEERKEKKFICQKEGCGWTGSFVDEESAEACHDANRSHHFAPQKSLASQIGFGGVLTKSGWVEKK